MTATLIPPALRGAASGALAGLVGTLGLVAAPVAAQGTPGPVALPGSADTARTAARAYVAAHDDRLPRGRRIVRYTVKPGDTATELAVRFHAWTAELISHNHLGPAGTMFVGQRLRIPVVVAAARKDRNRDEQKDDRSGQQRRVATRDQTRENRHRGDHVDPSRTRIRRIIVRTARRQGIDPQLALAVSWQEAGWQMHHVSSAGAIGVMQVIPPTGVWMSLYAGRYLNLRVPRDNVLAGVLLLDVLDDMTRTRRGRIGAYYQGIGAVREHGLYPETRHYVANVLAIKRRLEHGWNPHR